MTDLTLRRMNAEFQSSDDLFGREAVPTPSKNRMIDQFITFSPLLELSGNPGARWHLPEGKNSEWIREIVFQQREQMLETIQQQFGSLGIQLIEFHGPEIRLPDAYQAPQIRGALGNIGVTAHGIDETITRTVLQYSTLGGANLIQKCEPTTVSATMNAALQQLYIQLSTEERSIVDATS